MNNQPRSSNSKPKGNFQPKNQSKPQQRPKKRHESSTQPERRRRVKVDRETEVVVVSNVLGRFYYENPRMATIIDLHHIGDEEYVTVGDLRTILNSSRSILEGFQLLITECVDEQYQIEDILLFLGLDRKYEEYFSLNKGKKGMANVTDIRDFLSNTPVKAFEKIMESMNPKLRSRVIETAVTLFKLNEFGDYNKMRIIESYVHDELFDDAKESEVDSDIYI